MFYKLLPILFLFIPQYVRAHFWGPTLSFYTKAHFFEFDIWWILIVMLIEIGVFRLFIKKYSLQQIVIAVLLANAVSAGIGFIVSFTTRLELFPAQLILMVDHFIEIFPTIPIDPLIQMALQLAIYLIVRLLFGVVINTAIEYPAYYFYLKGISKTRLFWVTLFSNVLSNIFMVVIFIFSIWKYGGFGIEAPYSGRAVIEKMYRSNSDGSQKEIVSRAKPRKGSRVKNYPAK